MKLKHWLDKVAYITTMHELSFDSDDIMVYKSKFDDSYITHVGMEDDVKFLADLEITEELTHGVGFSKKDNKWYGWSHRAIYGFKIGSTCKEGDCHYIGSSLKEQEDAAVRFWSDDFHEKTWCEGIIKKDGESFFDIKWIYNDKIPNISLRNSTGGCNHYITKLGKGEWTAETMEDAKQMAIDFNEGVS